MRLGMNPQELIFRHLWCIDIAENVEQTRCDELVLDSRDAPGIFRMAFAGIVPITLRVTDIGSGQCYLPLLRCPHYPVYKFAAATETQGIFR